MTALTLLLAATTLSLDGLWDFHLEERKSMEDVSLPAFAADDKMTVPGAWDAMSHYFNRRGTGCYRRTFELKEDVADAFLVVDGCCLRSKYWIDGREIGFSKLPWCRFEYRTGALRAGRHEIVAAVDSLVDNSRVKLFWDFYDYYAFGGFHHGVWLELLSAPDDVRRLVVRTRDYKTGEVEIELRKGSPMGEKGEALAAEEDGEKELVFDGRNRVRATFAGGRVRVRVPEFKLWSPERPNLHTVGVVVGAARPHELTARFGIRQVGTARKRITLNGEPVYVKGVNRHEQHFEFGVTTPVQLMYEDVRNLKDLGGNFIRGSHYPQCEAFLDLCDELGVMVWEESVGWGNREPQLDDPEFRSLIEEQTRLMVRNSINHPCVIISSFLNECESELPQCKTLVDRLIEVIRAEDTGHLTTFASHRNDSDICHANTDVIAYNAYPGWYRFLPETGTAEEMRNSIRTCHDQYVKYFRDTYKDERPILVSEAGVKADWGAHDPRGKSQYSEDFQAEFEDIMLDEIFANPEIAGIAIWQFIDAKAYTRVTKGMRNRSYGINTGGLYDLYRRPKMVVDVVRRHYTQKVSPFK